MNFIDKILFRTQKIFFLPIVFVILLWLVFSYEVFFETNLSHYGIYPREYFGIRGVFLSAFLHGNFEHLVNNSLALLVLLSLLRAFYRPQSVKVIVLGILFSGLGTWLIGRSSYHIGASGLIYVLVSFIFFKGIFAKNYKLIAISLLVVLLYGGTIWYMFPDIEKGISWEGHLSGFLSGLGMAYFIKTPQYDVRKIVYDWEHPDFNPQNDVFMKNFDEAGNFNPPPKPEDIIKDYFSSSIKVFYDFIGINKK